MTPERYRQIGQIYHAALELESEERAAFLDGACGSDDELRHEVESLLQVPEKARDFIPNAVAEAVAQWQADSLVGRVIGNYKVLALIGEGGMGEIYLAQDTKLGRKVALKLLPKEFMQDEERVRRFEQEARAASALSHPNIVTIFEIGQADGAYYIVTEYIEGQTLRQRMQSRLPELSEVAEVGVQIASALAAAHESGIAHRDIKPENVMLRRDGYVKVLDFGIAKLIKDPRPPDPSAAPTLVSFDTGVGVAIGTAPYMSPEQVRGDKDIDTRTDIFSLGALLYEMVAGKSPFAANTVNEALAAVLHVEPAPLIAIQPDASPELCSIVEKALCKRREDRYQLASELQDDLLRLKRELEGGLQPIGQRKISRDSNVLRKTNQGRRHGKRAVIPMITGLIALAGAGYGIYKMSSPKPPSFQSNLIRLKTSGNVYRASISPDGQHFVYAEEQADQHRLWVRQINGTVPHEIVKLDNVTFKGMTYSPDGEYVYYTYKQANESNGYLYRVKSLGGPPQLLSDRVNTQVAFSPDGNSCAFGRLIPESKQSALVVVNADGTRENILKTHIGNDYFCSSIDWSPDGKTIACTSNSESSDNVVVVRVSDGEETTVTSGLWPAINSLAWLDDGSGLVVTAREKEALLFQIFLLDYPSGKAHKIKNDPNDYGEISLDARAKKLMATYTIRDRNIWLAPPDGNTHRAKQITFGEGEEYTDVSWTPNGNLLVSKVIRERLNLLLLDAEGKEIRQLTDSSHMSFRGQMSPDGRYIVYISNRNGVENIYRMNADGSNEMQLTNGSGEYTPRVTADSKWVLYSGDFSGRRSLWKVSIDGGTPLQLTDRKAMQPDISLDGSLVAFCYLDDQKNPKWRVGVMAMTGERRIKSFDLPKSIIRWLPGEHALTFINNIDSYTNIWAHTLDGKKPRPLTKFDSSQIISFDWSRDGKQLVMLRDSPRKYVVLFED